jgi:uncharacterized membrane protein YbhN (UPF0104 family)
MRHRIWAAIAFLLGFAVLLIALCHYYLLPAFDALKHATPADKARLRAWSALLLALVLFILISGLILTFRVGRFFFPRPSTPRTHTKHVDAWAEAGKRAQADPPTDSET